MNWIENYVAQLIYQLYTPKIRNTYLGMAWSLQLNGHTTGALRQAKRSWLLRCLNGKRVLQCLHCASLMSHVSKWPSNWPRVIAWLHPGRVHWTGSWRHCRLWFVVISSEPVHEHPSSLLGQKTWQDSTTLSKAMIFLKSDAWRGCLPTGQFLLLWTLIHWSIQALQNKWPSLQATAFRITYWL